MLEIIAIVILIISIFGIGVILYQKIPFLLKLPFKKDKKDVEKKTFSFFSKNKIRKKSFSNITIEGNQEERFSSNCWQKVKGKDTAFEDKSRKLKIQNDK